eukprot:403366124
MKAVIVMNRIYQHPGIRFRWKRKENSNQRRLNKAKITKGSNVMISMSINKFTQVKTQQICLKIMAEMISEVINRRIICLIHQMNRILKVKAC